MIIAIVGMSGSGKDTAARYIKEKFGIDMLVSYTTRPKREYETDGKEHWFISKEEMAQLKREETLIAYTVNEMTGIEYCATKSQLEGRDVVYIINPDGIHWLKEHTPEVELLTIYIDVPLSTLKNRILARGDNPAVAEKRLLSEQEEFLSFKDKKEYDILLCNNNRECFLTGLEERIRLSKKRRIGQIRKKLQ